MPSESEDSHQESEDRTSSHCTAEEGEIVPPLDIYDCEDSIEDPLESPEEEQDLLLQYADDSFGFDD